MLVERVKSGFLVAPDFKVTEFNHPSELAGAYAGWLTDQTFFVGGGYWLANRNAGREMATAGSSSDGSRAAIAAWDSAQRVSSAAGRATPRQLPGELFDNDDDRIRSPAGQRAGDGYRLPSDPECERARAPGIFRRGARSDRARRL